MQDINFEGIRHLYAVNANFEEKDKMSKIANNSMKTKIAIITFHDANNYGAVLQAIGLKKFLENNNYIVEFLGLKSSSGNISIIRKLLRTVKKFLKGEARKDRATEIMAEQYDNVFRDYEKKHLTTVEIKSIAELKIVSESYNCIIVGSDQIWNTNMHLLHGAGFRFFFLDSDLQCKRISYAASFGVSNQLEEKQALFAPLLQRFDSISVRDEFSRKIVSSVGCNSPFIVCDPTIIHDYSDIVEIPAIIDQLPEKYIFTYCLNKENESDYKCILSRLKTELNMPVVSITSFGHTHWEIEGCDKYIRTANPGEWIYLLANAHFVFTDSFHGTIFSMKNKRPFLTYAHQTTRGDRTKDLAKRYEFQNRLVSNENFSRDLIILNNKELDHYCNLMNNHRSESMEWLLSNIVG